MDQPEPIRLPDGRLVLPKRARSTPKKASRTAQAVEISPIPEEIPQKSAKKTSPSPEKFEIFLREYRKYPHQGNACKVADLELADIVKKARDDRDFSMKMLEAQDIGVTVLEDAAVERAIKGTEKHVYFQGQWCDSYFEPSDALLTLLLKANKAKYRGEETSQRRGLSEEAKNQLRDVFREASKELG